MSASLGCVLFGLRFNQDSGFKMRSDGPRCARLDQSPFVKAGGCFDSVDDQLSPWYKKDKNIGRHISISESSETECKLHVRSN